MDIRMYTYFGEYSRDIDESTKKFVDDMESDIDMEFVRNHQYTDAHRKKLDDFDILAKQMVGQRFAFTNTDGSILGGTVKSYNWDKYRVTIEFQLVLDEEPDADIEYSANVHSRLFTREDTVVITDESTPMPFDHKGVAANSLMVIM